MSLENYKIIQFYTIFNYWNECRHRFNHLCALKLAIVMGALVKKIIGDDIEKCI